MDKKFFVYILASRKYGTLYVGITNNLVRRVYEHKNNLIAGFTKKYRIHFSFIMKLSPIRFPQFNARNS